jgi:NDP-sugar pyrophosphorylase family protein
MLATKISFWNEIFLICKGLGIDSQVIADIAALDPRIGKYGTVHGKAFGGKCLPKDLKAFIDFAERDQNVKLLKAVGEINEGMKTLYLIKDIIEKPSEQEAPSNIGTVGRYILTPEIFDYIKETPLGKGNEIRLTDAIRMLIKKEKKDVYAYKFEGKRYDAGDKLGYVKAIVDFALERRDLRGDIERYLREIAKSE